MLLRPTCLATPGVLSVFTVALSWPGAPCALNDSVRVGPCRSSSGAPATELQSQVSPSRMANLVQGDANRPARNEIKGLISTAACRTVTAGSQEYALSDSRVSGPAPRRERDREGVGPGRGLSLSLTLPLLRSKRLINIFLYVLLDVPQGPGKSYSAEVIDLSSPRANKDQNKKAGSGGGLGWGRKINLGSFDDAKMGKAIITLAPILQIARRNPIWAYFLFLIFFAANKEKPRPVKVK